MIDSRKIDLFSDLLRFGPIIFNPPLQKLYFNIARYCERNTCAWGLKTNIRTKLGAEIKDCLVFLNHECFSF